MRLKVSHFLFTLLLSFIISCDNNIKKIDTSNIPLDLNFSRFEIAMFSVADGGIDENEILELEKQFSKFYPLYVGPVMRFGESGSIEVLTTINQFTADADIKMLFKEVVKTYPLGSLKEEFNLMEEGFKRFKYYFPDRIIPEIRTMISAFSYNTVVGDSVLAIGIDTYLGGDFPIYEQTGIPKYKFEKFSREYLVSDALKAWIVTEFEESGGKNLLEQMIYQGKILYLLQNLLPELDEQIIFNYFVEELEWCQNNEAQIWFHFIDMELLYTVENHLIKKYLGDAPFISGFPEGSPGRVGQWIGYQIVNSYMKNNSEVDLSGLFKVNDANLILQKSKYKPNR